MTHHSGWAIFDSSSARRIPTPQFLGYGFRQVREDGTVAWHFPPSQDGFPGNTTVIADGLLRYEKHLADEALWRVSKAGPKPRYRGYMYIDPAIANNREDEMTIPSNNHSSRDGLKKVYIKTMNPFKTKMDGITDSKGTVWLKQTSSTPKIVQTYIKLITEHEHYANKDKMDLDVTEEDEMGDEQDANALAWVGFAAHDKLYDFSTYLKSGKKDEERTLFKKVLHDILQARANVVTERRKHGLRIDDQDATSKMDEATATTANHLIKHYENILGRTNPDATGLLNILSSLTAYSPPNSQKLRSALIEGQPLLHERLVLARTKFKEHLKYLNNSLSTFRGSTQDWSFRDRIAMMFLHTEASVMVVYLSDYTPSVIHVKILLSRTHSNVPIKTTATFVDFIPCTLGYPLARYVLKNVGNTYPAPVSIFTPDIQSASFRPAKFPKNYHVRERYWLTRSTEDPGKVCIDRLPPQEDTETKLNTTTAFWFSTTIDRQTITGMLFPIDGLTSLAAVHILSATENITGRVLNALESKGKKKGSFYIPRLSIVIEPPPGLIALTNVNHGKAYDVHIRQSVLRRVAEGNSSKSKIAREFGISVDTVRRYVEQASLNVYRHRQGENHAYAVLQNSKLSVTDQFVLYQVTTSLGTITAEEYIWVYNHVAGIVGVAMLTVRPSTVNRWRKRMGLTYKRAGLAPTNSYVRSVAAATHYFESSRLPQLQKTRNKLIFVDETSLYLNEAPTMSWGPSGKEHTVAKNKNQGLATRFIVAVGFPTWSDSESEYTPFVRYWVLPPHPVDDPGYNIRPVMYQVYQDMQTQMDYNKQLFVSKDMRSIELEILKGTVTSTSSTLKSHNLDGSNFRQFLEFKISTDPRSRGCTICMDNAPIHNKHSEIAGSLGDLFEQMDWKVQWLPIYNPHYNVAELALSFIKHHIRKTYPTTYKELVYQTHLACEAIRYDHVLGWFRKCGYIPSNLKQGARIDMTGNHTPQGSSFTTVRKLVNKDEHPIRWPPLLNIKQWPKPLLLSVLHRLTDLTREIFVTLTESVGGIWKPTEAYRARLIQQINDNRLFEKSAAIIQTSLGLISPNRDNNTEWIKISQWKRYNYKHRLVSTPAAKVSTIKPSHKKHVKLSIEWPTRESCPKIVREIFSRIATCVKPFLVSHSDAIWQFSVDPSNPLYIAVKQFGPLTAYDPPKKWVDACLLLQSFRPGSVQLVWIKTKALEMVSSILKAMADERKASSAKAITFHTERYRVPVIRNSFNSFQEASIIPWSSGFQTDEIQSNLVITPPSGDSIIDFSQTQHDADVLVLADIEMVIKQLDNNIVGKRKNDNSGNERLHAERGLAILRTRCHGVKVSESQTRDELHKKDSSAICDILAKLPRDIRNTLERKRRPGGEQDGGR